MSLTLKIVGIVHKEDNNYGICFPDLPGLVTAGSTIDELQSRAVEGIISHLKVMKEYGQETDIVYRTKKEILDDSDPDLKEDLEDFHCLLEISISDLLVDEQRG